MTDATQPDEQTAAEQTGPEAPSSGPSEPPPEPQTSANAKQAPARDDRPRIVARYGLLGALGEFTCSKKLQFSPGSKLVLQTERGIEIGEHMPLPGTEGTVWSADPEMVRRCVEQSGSDAPQRHVGRVLRVATEQDLSEERHINAGAADELTACQRLVTKHGLPMKLITCEHLFGGERIVFYFMAEGRVDFRQLVRDLAREYQTRIEMRQVGARDEARLVADYEICGRECCCKNFLKTLRPVSMKMAKMQKATLDPSKVSGRCGRLRCCLRFEHEVYDELNQRLFRNNTWVRTPDGDGRVVDRQVLTQLATVELENQRRVTYPVEEIEMLAEKPPQRPAAPAAPSREQADQAERSKEAADSGDRPRRRRRRRRPQNAQPNGPTEREAQPKPQQSDDSESSASQEAPPTDGAAAETTDAARVESKAAPDGAPSGEPPSAEAAPRAERTEGPGSGQEPADTAKRDGKRRSRGRRRRRRPRKGGNKDGGQDASGPKRGPDEKG